MAQLEDLVDEQRCTIEYLKSHEEVIKSFQIERHEHEAEKTRMEARYELLRHKVMGEYSFSLWVECSSVWS